MGRGSDVRRPYSIAQAPERGRWVLTRSKAHGQKILAHLAKDPEASDRVLISQVEAACPTVSGRQDPRCRVSSGTGGCRRQEYICRNPIFKLKVGFLQVHTSFQYQHLRALFVPSRPDLETHFLGSADILADVCKGSVSSAWHFAESECTLFIFA